MAYTDDPARDWDAYCREQEREEKMLPKCSKCGEPILDEYVYDIDGELYCEECLHDFRQLVENYINY